jgi:hypothetical protein
MVCIMPVCWLAVGRIGIELNGVNLLGTCRGWSSSKLKVNRPSCWLLHWYFTMHVSQNIKLWIRFVANFYLNHSWGCILSFGFRYRYVFSCCISELFIISEWFFALDDTTVSKRRPCHTVLWTGNWRSTLDAKWFYHQLVNLTCNVRWPGSP